MYYPDCSVPIYNAGSMPKTSEPAKPHSHTASKIERHPQYRLICQALINGDSCRKISSWTEPRIPDRTLSTFAQSFIRPAISRANQLDSLLNSPPPLPTENKALIPSAAQLPAQSAHPAQVGASTANKDARISNLAVSAIVAAPVLALRENRLAALEDRRRRLDLVMRQRGLEMANECAGGESGLLVRDFKGKDASQVVYKVDTGLLAEQREHDKQIAQELGQWQEGSGPMVAIQIVCPAAPTQARRQSPDPEAIDISIVSK